MKLTADVDTPGIIKFWLFVVGFMALVAVLYYAYTAIAALLAAGFIGLATYRPIGYFSHYMPGNSRKLAALVLFGIIAVIVVGIAWLVIPMLITQTRTLLEQLPALLADLETGFGLASQLERFGIVAALEASLLSIVEGVLYSAEATRTTVEAALLNVVNVVFAVVIGFLLAVHAPFIAQQTDVLLPQSMRTHWRILRSRIGQAVSGFIGGQLIITSIAATLTLILLTIFNIPAPLSLAAFIWLTGLIPLVGNTLGAVVVIIVAFSQSPLIALGLTVYYIVYQQVENNVFEPIIQAHTVHLTPLLVLVAALIGVYIAGFVGAILAIPAAASVRILVIYILQRAYTEHRARYLGKLLDSA